ncbi:MAG TPA: PH domain-containing protein [Candidatus Saccharimonadales bacterium]
MLCLIGLPIYAANNEAIARSFGFSAASMPSAAVVAIPFLAFSGLVLLGGIIATYVYLQNKFFLTNESVIQHIQTSLFSRKEQTISLTNIEDASYRQHGILQTILNYGNIRLSTQGEETTYRFSYVSNPKHQIALLNDAVEAFKMGRPPSAND